MQVIPQDVFLNHILPLLNFQDVKSLLLLNKDWMKRLDIPDVWNITKMFLPEIRIIDRIESNGSFECSINWQPKYWTSIGWILNAASSHLKDNYSRNITHVEAFADGVCVSKLAKVKLQEGQIYISKIKKFNEEGKIETQEWEAVKRLNVLSF